MTSLDRKKVFLWQILAVVGLNLAYVFVISEKYSYMGFQFELNLGRLIFSSSYLLLIILIGLRIRRPFMFAAWNVIFLLLFAGEMIFYQYNPDAGLTYPLIATFCLMLIVIFSKIKIKLKPLKVNVDFLATILSIFLFIPFVIYFYRYINLKNLLLIDVYETRMLFRKISNPYSRYLMAPLARILLPMLIIKNLEKRKYIKTAIFSSMIIYLYLCGALKSVFIGLLSLLFFYKGDYVEKTTRFLKTIVFITFVGVIVATLFNNVFLLDAFVRRVFFVPPYLNNIYINYFTNNYTYFSHSPLGLNLVQYNYDRPLSMYVGEVVLGQSGLNANVGLITEGYVSFGLLGGMFFALIISLLILYFNMINIDHKYFGIIFVYIYYFNTSFLSTLLLTHGLFLLIVFSFLFLRKTSEPI